MVQVTLFRVTIIQKDRMGLARREDNSCFAPTRHLLPNVHAWVRKGHCTCLPLTWRTVWHALAYASQGDYRFEQATACQIE